MDLLEVAKALSNETRLRLVELIVDNPDSASTVHQRYQNTYDDQKRRESIYRALETLVEAGLLTKQYQKEKGLVYSLAHKQLIVDFHENDVRPVVEQESEETNDVE